MTVQILKAAIEGCKGDTITVTAFAIDRILYVDKKLVKPSYGRKVINKADGFQWGNKGKYAQQMAGAILLRVIDKKLGLDRQREVVQALIPEFTDTFIATIKGHESFTATIKFKDWLKHMLAYTSGKAGNGAKLEDFISFGATPYDAVLNRVNEPKTAEEVIAENQPKEKDALDLDEIERMLENGEI